MVVEYIGLCEGPCRKKLVVVEDVTRKEASKLARLKAEGNQIQYSVLNDAWMSRLPKHTIPQKKHKA